MDWQGGIGKGDCQADLMFFRAGRKAPISGPAAVNPKLELVAYHDLKVDFGRLSMEANSGAFVLLLILAAIYFLPSLIAAIRGVRNGCSVFILNLFLGRTFIGWVVALAMAFATVDRRKDVR